jgi:hypothetical protein
MKKVTARFDEDFLEDLRELARRKETSVAALIRYALDYTFEDALDVIAGEQGWAEYQADPSSTISLADLIRQEGIELQR